MRANYVGNTALQERLHRPEPEVRAIVEAVVTSQQDTKETSGEWAGMDSQTGFTFPRVGGARLARDTDATLASYAVASADEGQVTTDLDNQPPYHVIEVEWTAANAPEWEIHDLTTKIDPDVDGTGREVAEVYAQLYQVTREDFDGEDTREIRAISSRQSAEVSGNAETTLTWNFSGGDVGEPPTADQGRETTRPKTWIIVRAVTSDGEPAGNIAWIGDTTESNPTTDDQSNANLRHYVIDQIDSAARISIGGQYLITNPSPGGLPEFDIGSKDYTAATASFTGTSNQIDLGSAPASGTDLVVVAQGEEPFDSSLTWEISDDGGTSWNTVADGDVIGEDNTPDGNDLSGVSRQQTYDVRVTLTPTSDNRASPFARRLGVEEVTTTDLDGVASVEDAGNWSFDPVTLVGEIPEATISLLKEGVRDYRSQGEKLFADNHIGDMDFRIWIGHPDLPRKNWLHVDTFEVDDYNSEGGAIEVIGLSPLKQLKTGIPPYDESANERTPVTYTNQTLKAAWDDLLDSQVALPGRFRGPGVEDTTSQSVTKTIRDSDGKTELDAIAHLAGGTVVTSQGTVKYQEAFTEDKGGVRQTFPQEEIRVQGVRPGYRNRVEEYFVSYAYDDDRDEFDGAVRSFYAPSIAKLGGKGLDMEEDLDEAAARWLPTPNDTNSNDPAQNLAAHVARRTTSPNGLGPGLKQVRFESTIPHPELEPGDSVVVETDQLVIKDPATDTAFRGLLWLTGVVQTQHDIWGRELTVWVQQIEDAIPSEEDSDRDSFASPEVLSASIDIDSYGTSVDITGKVQDADAVRIATSTSAFPSRSTTQSASLQSVDADDTFEVSSIASISSGQQIYVSILAYENSDGSGSESDDLFKIRDRRQNPDGLGSTGSVDPSQGMTTGEGIFVKSSPTDADDATSINFSGSKSILFGPQNFQPADDGTAWNKNLIYVSTNDLNESFYFAIAPLPLGVTIDAVRARVYAFDLGQGDVTEVGLYKADRTAQTNTQIGSTLSPDSSDTWQTKEDTSISETVPSADSDVYLVRFRGDAGSATTACRVAWVELDYSAPSVESTY